MKNYQARTPAESNQRGFTLIELLVVIAVPIGFQVPTVQKIREGINQKCFTQMNLASSPSAVEPTAVPGTELHDNVAYIKPGYKFVNRGDAVDVMEERIQVKTGTYICPCHSKDPTRKCEMVFTTRRITCRSGSCVSGSGSCLLTAAAPPVRR